MPSALPFGPGVSGLRQGRGSVVGRAERFVAAFLLVLLLPFAGPARAGGEPAAAVAAPAAAGALLPAPGGIGALTPDAPAGFAGSATCATCHEGEAQDWLTSQHAGAMSLPVPATVRGDFSDVEVGRDGARARFFRDGARYMVEIAGRDGRPQAFPVAYTFGLFPLQQYLVQMPDGRVQALPFAYDTRPAAQGGQRWFHLYGDNPPAPGDSLYWTGPQQNWNFMCAECHSTGVRKGFDAATDRFDTRFSEISVGCESCHGPGSGHVAWARGGADPATPGRGFASVAATRPEVDWTPDPKTGSPAASVPHPPGDGVETCARCHARRGVFAEDWKPGRPLTETHLPVLLDPGLFEADGQNLDEDFNDHAFKQSLMYARGVTCTDCHNPHTATLKAPGALVCSQCHLADRFEAQSHTGHPPGPGAPDCISCHMPKRTYMVVDDRHDHSFRIPRPDLSVRNGTPNTCNACHADKTAAWAAEAIARWHGPERKGFQVWANAFNDARSGAPQAREALIALAANPVLPGVVRATAVSGLQAYPSRAADAATLKALGDGDPLVRLAALRVLAAAPPEVRWQHAGPLLDDPSAAVRLEAAAQLADIAPETLSPADRTRLAAGIAAYEAAQALNADRVEDRANMGLFRLRQGNAAAAEAEFRAGLVIDPTAAAVRVDLADLFRAQGREADAEAVLRQGLALHDDAALEHALGLTLVRQKRYGEALEALRRANALAPDQARYAYVLAVALQSMGEPAQAAAVVQAALQRQPNDAGLLGLALNEALEAQDAARARSLSGLLSALRPDDAALSDLAGQLGAAPGPGAPASARP